MTRQTAKMFGERPVSRLKTFFFGAGIFLLTLVIGSLVGGLCVA